jgi:ribonuclease P protein component
VLSEPHRLRRHVDFSRAVRHGHRIGRRDLVIHAYFVDSTALIESLRSGGPRIGLIVNKAVGPAVVRHRVARRLRHVCADLIGEREMPTDLDVVIRVLPSASTVSSDELSRQVRSALTRVVRRGITRTTASIAATSDRAGGRR